MCRGQRLWSQILARPAQSFAEKQDEFRRGLARLRRLNAEVVVLLRRYGQAVVRRGGERLGIAPGA